MYDGLKFQEKYLKKDSAQNFFFHQEIFSPPRGSPMKNQEQHQEHEEDQKISKFFFAGIDLKSLKTRFKRKKIFVQNLFSNIFPEILSHHTPLYL